jgi:eukaryotic-like serine/threonine-protein kinase
MLTTTRQDVNATITHGGDQAPSVPNELVERYHDLLSGKRLNWTSHLKLLKRLGSGGQGVVYLTELRGTDEFTLPAALKIFSPERFDDAASYDDSMYRVARASARIAQIQHDNLLYVYNFVDRQRIRMLVMEWVDGYDLARLLTNPMLQRFRDRSSQRRWDYINRVIVTAGPVQPRMKAGVAVAIVRDCLSALAALHRHGIVHGDIKPSNIMLKRTGIAKIVDIGSAFEMRNPPKARPCTLAYAAPEVLENCECTPRSDLCSLGYVLIELLAGRPCFNGITDLRELLEAKRTLPMRLHEILPQEVLCCELLLSFCRGMIRFVASRAPKRPIC